MVCEFSLNNNTKEVGAGLDTVDEELFLGPLQ